MRSKIREYILKFKYSRINFEYFLKYKVFFLVLNNLESSVAITKYFVSKY